MRFKPAELEFIDTEVNVRYAETDQMGIVHHANYLVWFELGRVAWCRVKGFNYGDFEVQGGRFMMVGEVRCRYKAPARFMDDLLIRTVVSSATDKVIRFQYEVRHKNTGRLLATGDSAHVVTDTAFRPARLPEQYKTYFLPPAGRS